MLTLNDGRAELWQWDTGRTLAVDADCSQVHFSNKVFGRSIDVDVVEGVANIPDILLQTDKDLNVWAFVGTAENGYTKISKTFTVNRRNKPADYVFTPPEQTTLAELVEQIGNLDELTTKAKDNLVAAINEAAKTGSGEGGTSDHSKLNNRNADDQHPMSAITGLVKALDGKMDSNNPVGSGSFSMGRKSGTVVGYNSHAEGYDTTASDSSSHAEGDSTTASGGASHAEGSSTTASGVVSHAEGSSTIASGDYSHAEGHSTKASGNHSHVQGKYNIEDSSNLYAHIVGNGTSDTARSNAHTLDWSGNAWFAGDVFVGSASGTNKDDGSKKLATEEYVNNEIADCIKAPATASVGQTIIVKAVDENGKPTAWAPVDMPDALPNPNALTFTGAVTGSYDGSAPVSVEIPSGGGSGSAENWRLVNTLTTAEDVSDIRITQDSDGNPLSLKKVKIFAKVRGNSASLSTWCRITVNNLTNKFYSDIQNTFAAKEGQDYYNYARADFAIYAGRLMLELLLRSANNAASKNTLWWVNNSGCFENYPDVVDAITSIRMWSASAGIGAGTELMIYGVDA